MRAVFLDIDGVLVTQKCFVPGNMVATTSVRMIRRAWEPAVDSLNQLLEETGASVVVSSTWRSAGLLAMREYLTLWGVKANVIGCTPRLEKKHPDYNVLMSVERGHEIQSWLDGWQRTCKSGREIESFVILDDDADMAHLKPYLVQTNFEDGFTAAHIDKAKEILSA